MDEALISRFAEMPTKPLSLSADVTARIGRAIVVGEYELGSLIEDEATLSKRFGVSRTVVRDAIKVLVGKNLLEVRRGIGTRVKPREQWGLLDVDVLAWQLSAPTSAKTLLQLAEVRQMFEPQAAAWAAERATNTEVQNIRDALEAMRNCIVSPELFLMADARFHRSVLRAAHNEFLLALAGVTYSTLLSGIRLMNSTVEQNRRAFSVHEDVYMAIERRDGTVAKLKMNMLIEGSSCRIKALLTSV